MLRGVTFALGFAFMCVSLCPSTAHAYRTAGEAEGLGSRVRLASDAVRLLVSERGALLADGETSRAAELAAETWNNVTCSDFALSVRSQDVSAEEMSFSVSWVADWDGAGLDPESAATTDVRFVDSGSGYVIAEADVLINAQHFDWTIDRAERDERQRDLVAVLTHEFGHALGIAHPCERMGTDEVPMCNDTHNGIALHPVYAGSAQRSLAGDDVEALCFLYPTAACEMTCEVGATCVGRTCVDVCDTITCGDGARCEAGVCRPADVCTDCRDGEVGDPCSDDAQCLTSVCASEGYCTRSCSGGSCPDRLSCVDDGGRALCEATGGVLGDLCDTGMDCSSRLCLTESSEDATVRHCTRSCADQACPSDFTCRELDADSFCVRESSVGCGVGVGSSPLSAPLWFALILFFRRREPGSIAVKGVGRRRSSFALSEGPCPSESEKRS